MVFTPWIQGGRSRSIHHFIPRSNLPLSHSLNMHIILLSKWTQWGWWELGFLMCAYLLNAVEAQVDRKLFVCSMHPSSGWYKAAASLWMVIYFRVSFWWSPSFTYRGCAELWSTGDVQKSLEVKMVITVYMGCLFPWRLKHGDEILWSLRLWKLFSAGGVGEKFRNVAS